MTNSWPLDELRWHGTLPLLQDIQVLVPDNITRLCITHFSDVQGVLESNSDSSAYQTIKDWVQDSLGRIEKAPGVLCYQAKDSKLTDGQLRVLYCTIACAMGTLNTRYGALFDVKDRDLDYTKEAIPVSKTKASTGFHTDSTAVEYSPDIVGLLCLQPAYKGGESQLANATDLYNWVNKHYPEDVKILSQPIIRDVITPGTVNSPETIRKNKFPVFTLNPDGFRFRYMRYWITTGYEKSNTPVPQGLNQALDRIDKYLSTDEHILTFNMERGDMLFVNNTFICHSRTSFEDSPDKDKKRMLVRAWINHPA
jgi:hypothetical protein